MHTHRFGRKLKLPSTRVIKQGILRLMLQDELKKQPLAAAADEFVVTDGLSATQALNDIGSGIESLQCALALGSNEFAPRNMSIER